MKKLYFLLISLLTLALMQSVQAQITEKFTTETDGATSFSEGSFTFSTTTGYFEIDNRSGYGYDDDDYLMNAGTPIVGGGVVGSIKNSLTDFKVESLYIIPLQSNTTNISTNNNILIRGKLNGSTQFTYTLLYSDINNSSLNNYFTYLDLSSYSSYTLDELEFEIEPYGSNTTQYLMIDEFRFSSAATAPTTQASNVGFSGTSASQTTLSWTRGDGDNCVVFMSAGSSGTASPVNSTTYSANSAFGSGTQIGSTGWYCIYNGSSTGTTVTGLNTSTTYRVHVCEYNEGAGSELYLTSAGTDNPDNVTTLGPEIDVQGNITSIADGNATPTTADHTDFGSTGVSSGTVVRTFVIHNTGDASLNLTGTPYVSLSGAHSSDFSVSQPSSSTVATSGTVTFEVTFDPSAVGTRSATISIDNNDTDENPYNFSIQGTSYTTPNVTTTAASSIGTTSATLGGNVTSDGGATVTERGVVYSTTDATPTIAEGATKDSNGSGTGTFSESIGSLSPGTTYYYNSYAINPESTSYGTASSFITLKLSQTITFEALLNKTYGDTDFDPGATASSGLTVTYSSSNTDIVTIVDGKIHIIGVGTCTIYADQDGNATYNAASQKSQLLTINKITTTITGSLVADDSFNRPWLDSESTYEPAGNQHDDDYVFTGNEVTKVTTGASSYFTRTIVPSASGDNWTLEVTYSNLFDVVMYLYEGDFDPDSPLTNLYRAVDDGNNENDRWPFMDGTGLSSDGITLTSGQKYVLVIASFFSEAEGNFTVEVKGLGSADIHTLPVITTQATTNIDLYTATGNGNISYVGVPTATQHGVCWNTTGTPIIADIKTEEGAVSATGAFASNITGLSINTTYYVRAYATNSAGTTYGEEKSFTTNKIDQSITFGTLSTKTYGNTDFDPGATSSSALAVTYSSSNTSVATIVSGKIHIVGAGTCTIHADQVGNTTYNAATQKSQSLTINKANPAVTAWPTAAGIAYGEDLSSATLSGSTASVAGSFDYDDNTITPDAGTYSADVTFTPTDATNYNTASGNIDVTVTKATPTVTAWPTAEGITYGEDLSSATLSGSTASVAGSFDYDDNTITPDAGTYSADVTFTPTDAINYNIASGNIDVVVAKANPTVSVWPTAAGIAYGEDLSSATLSGGTASVAGSFDYDDNTITPDAGTYSADVTFTPTDATNYNIASGNIDVVVAKANPTVSVWPTAAGIAYGEDLSSATLSGGTASVAGSFDYDDNTITPDAGTYSADVTFTPTDATNYNIASGNIDVTVTKATPTVTAWPTAEGITYGEDLSSATLSGGTASVAGSFDYDDNTITPDAGTYSADVTFTPTDASNYNTVSGNVDVTVDKADPSVTTWPTANSITYGNDLSSATLSGGTASVAGSFDYDDNTITPDVGTYSADVTFTPTDASNYNTVSGNVDVAVDKADPSVTTWPTANGITYGNDLSSATLSGGAASVAGSFAYDDNTLTPDAGTYSADVTFTPTDASNYNTVSGNVDVAVDKADPSVTTWPTANGITYGNDLSSATLSGGTASVAGSFDYDDNTITPDVGTYSADVTFTPTDASNYNTVSGNVDVAVDKADPSVTTWPTANGITYGNDLSSATLSGGTASVAGSFDYDDNTITPDAGTYSADVTFTPTDATNYNTASGNIDVTVTKATPTVTAWSTATGITYGEDLSSATLSGGTASVAGSFDYDDNTITPDAGTYSADVTFTPTDASNYNTVSGNVDVAVDKADPSVTTWPTANGITYGNDLSSATLSGGTASVAGSFDYDDNTITPDAGTYSADVTFTPTDATNYNIASGNIDVAVAKATLSATANDTSKTYGYNNPTFTIAYSGFVNSENETAIDTDPTAATTVDESSNVGTYDITLTGGTDDNYSFSLNNGTLTVNKATLTATAEDKTKDHGTINPEFTINYTGFVNSDDELDIDTGPAITCTADESSPVGTYDLIISGGEDNNYDFDYMNGILTVNATTGILSVNTSEIKVYPNPAADYVKISSSNIIYKVEVIDLLGIVRISEIIENKHAQIDLNTLENGIYLIQLKIDDHLVTKRIIKR